MKMKVVIDVLIGAVPLYDKDGGKRSFIAGSPGVKLVAKNRKSVLLPMFRVTPSLLRSMADTLEFAQKEGRWSAVLAVRERDNTAGLLCR